MINYQPHPPIGALTTPPPVQRPLVERIADKMLEMGMNGTAVTKESLFEHSDFTLEQIEQHGPDAANLARSRAVRQQS